MTYKICEHLKKIVKYEIGGKQNEENTEEDTAH
jgi:hypothetical protein